MPGCYFDHWPHSGWAIWGSSLYRSSSFHNPMVYYVGTTCCTCVSRFKFSFISMNLASGTGSVVFTFYIKTNRSNRLFRLDCSSTGWCDGAFSNTIPGSSTVILYCIHHSQYSCHTRRLEAAQCVVCTIQRSSLTQSAKRVPSGLRLAWFPWSLASWPSPHPGISVALLWLKRLSYWSKWPDWKHPGYCSHELNR